MRYASAQAQYGQQAGSVLPTHASPLRGPTILMQQEPVESEHTARPGEEATSAAPTLWPEAKPVPPTPDDTSVGPKEGFDYRIIGYVGLPALVLIGQLFFTFSRDAMGEMVPAVMDVDITQLSG